MARKMSSYRERVVEMKFPAASPCPFCRGKLNLGDMVRYIPGHELAHEHCGRGESLPKIGATR